MVRWSRASIVSQYCDSGRAGKRAQTVADCRDAVWIEFGKNANHQIGGVCLIGLLLSLSRDGVGCQWSILWVAASCFVLTSSFFWTRIKSEMIHSGRDMIPIRGMRTHAGREFSS